MVSLTLTPGFEVTDDFLSHWHRHHYPNGQIIVHAGDRSDTLFLIVEGAVTVLLEDEEGREIILAYLNKGDFFGEMGLFDDEAGRSACVRAKGACELAEITYTRAREMAEEYPQLLYAIGTQMADRLRSTSRRLGDLAFLDVTGRIARALLDLCRQPDAMTHPDGMQIRITRQEIGRIVGCSREMAGRVLKTLEEQHLVSVSGKTIVVLGARPDK